MLDVSAFGKNDIRGIYGENVTEEVFYYTGRGFVKYLEEQTKLKPSEIWITVCRDARLHSPALSKSLIEGIRSCGANVVDMGLAPTPLGYYSEVVGLPPFVTKYVTLLPLSHLAEAGDMFGCGAAATPYDVHKSLVYNFFHEGCHLPGRLGVISVRIRETGIRVARNGPGADAGKLPEPRAYLARAEGAVDTQRRDGCMAHGGDESLQGLARECPSVTSGYSQRDHHREFPSTPGCHLGGSVKTSLEVERVKHCLEEEHIHSPLGEGVDLLPISL